MRLATASYLMAVLGIVTGPLVARSLGPTGRGEYAAVLTYSGFTAVVIALGMTQTINYALQTLKIEPARVFGVVLRFCGLIVLPAAVIAAGVSVVLLRDFSSTARIGAAVFTALAPLGVLQICLTSFVLAEGALGVLTRVRVAPLLFSAGAVILLAAVGRLTLTTYLIATLVGTLLALGMILHGIRLRPKLGGRLGPQLRFGIRAYPGSLALLANAQLDQALIAPFLGAATLGIYAIAVSLAQLPLGLVQAVAARGISEVSRPEGGLDPDLAGEVLRRGLLLTALFSAAVAVVVPLFIPLIYGAAFSSAVPLCLVLLIGTVAIGVTTTSSFCLTLAGRPGVTSVAELASLVVTACALLALLPTIGVLGAAIASTLAYWTRALLQVRALRGLGVTHFVPRRADVHAVVAIVRQRIPIAALRR
jgi:O-antigen/teichoic acid export membrane protein